MTNYDAFAKTFSNSRKNHSWPEIEYIIKHSLLSSESKILDIGCGNGRLLTEWEKYTKKPIPQENYLGIDNSLGMIQEAQLLHPGYHFEHRDMIALGEIPENSFSHVFAIASFHHINNEKDRLKTLSEIKRILIPGGTYIMTNWNLREQQKYKVSEESPGEYSIKIGEYSRYYHGFTIDEIEDLGKRVGLHIQKNSLSETGRNIITECIRD